MSIIGGILILCGFSETWGLSDMDSFYLKDLELLLRIRYELEHVPMTPEQRQIKETSFEAVQIVLDMYVVDLR